MTRSTALQLAPSSWPGAGGSTYSFGPDQDASLFQAALAGGGAAAWHSDLRTRARWWSPNMFAIHGLREDGDVPSDYMDLVHPSDRGLVEAKFRESVESGFHKIQYRVVWRDGSTHWIEGAGRTQRADDGALASISGICSLIDDRKREESDLRFLAQASSEFARSTDYAETLRRVATLAVPHFADWCAVDMLDGQGELRRLAVAHVDPAKVSLAQELHQRYPPDPTAPVGAWNVVRTGQAELIAEIPDELLRSTARDEEHLSIARSLGLRSYLGVPLLGPDRVMGVITFVSSDSGRFYGQRDLQLALDLASRAAIAIQNAELFRALRVSESRQRLLLTLTDVLRRPGDTGTILSSVSAILAKHFVVSRVGFGHVDETKDLIDYEVCWTDGTVVPLLGRYPASAFGPQVIEKLRSGATVAIRDVRDNPLTSESQTIQTSHEVDARAILVVPLFREGQLRTIVYLNQGPARQWTPDEVALMEEVAERTRELIERTRTERALRDSESRWRVLFERMTEGFFVAEGVRDENGVMTDFLFKELNPAFERLTGIAPAAALGRQVSEVIPGFPKDVIETYARVVDTGLPEEFEVLVPALNDRWYEARARHIGGERFSVLFLEVTERKRAQLALELSAQRYKTLFETIDEGFCILEVLFDGDQHPLDYRFLEVNPAFERQSGLVAARGRTILELVPDIEHEYIRTYGRVALTGESIRFESRAEAMDRWFDAFAFRVGEPGQRRVALLFTDITERKRAQAALQDRELQLREAQRLAGIGSWYWDLKTDRTDPSPELLRIFGFEESNDLPKFEAQRGVLYPDAEWDRLKTCVTEAVENGISYAVDVQAICGQRPIWVTARGSPVRDVAGAVIGLRGTVQDVTERKQIEEALRKADARKDEFLATLAHELRNPLAPLRNGLAILQRSDGVGPHALRARELMERQLAHLVRLVDDLLDVSRVSQGKVTMKKEVATVHAVVEQALETAMPLIEASGHRLEIRLPPGLPSLHADSTRMAQVLSNLLGNAAKYTPAGGHIVVEAESDGDRVCVRITDDGIGIPADMLENVFELFTQVGSATERAQGGLGIGLALARRLVELHDGTVRAESPGPGRGRGSVFTVELPALPVQMAAGHESRSQASVRAPGRRVLVVDDNVDAAETLALLLQFDGHDVQVVHRGKEAIDAASAGKPEIVFLDIGLPDLSGLEVARRLRSNPGLEQTLIVALTGWGSERDREQATQSGIDFHLTKPVSQQDLGDVLMRHRN